MDTNIKVSITLPVFNHEEYIVQAIESVLMQQVKFKYELLIGEDCSSDSSLELINRYRGREEIKIFARKKNMNTSIIRNGLDLKMRTKGEYIITLEGDDFWTDPFKLQKQVEFLDSHPDYIACGHGFQVVDRKGTPYHDEDFECQFFQDNPYNQKIFEKGLMLSHLNSLMYRNFFVTNTVDIRLFTDFKAMGGDYLLTAYLVLNGKIYCLPENMSSYRKVTDISSSSFSAGMERNNRRDKQYKCIKEAEKFLNQTYKISFAARKKSAYASAVFKWNRERTGKNFRVIMNIVKISEQPIKYLWWLIYLLSARFFKNCLGRKNERVRF